MSDTHVPFTDDEVESLNGYQKARVFHPFTCGNRGDEKHARINSPEDVLVATSDGWVCPYCDYRQDWAHAWMADWSWTKLEKVVP